MRVKKSVAMRFKRPCSMRSFNLVLHTCHHGSKVILKKNRGYRNNASPWQVVIQHLTFSCVTGRTKATKEKIMMSETGRIMVVM